LATPILWLLYAGCAVAVVALARFLRRPFPFPQFLLFLLLPVLFLGRGFISDATPIPVEDVRLIAPWSSLPPAFGVPEPIRNPNLNDIALQIAPWAKAVRVAWKAGDLPWLDRWNGCGTPLAANAQSAAFSPFTFLGFALPLARAFTLEAAVKLLIALAGMSLWLSELRLSRTASTFGAIAFAFSLEMTIWLPWPITAVVCLWPAALFLLELLDDPAVRPRARWVLAAVLVAWSLGGHPESAALGGIFVGLWLAFRLLTRAFRHPRSVLASAAGAAAFAVAATAFLVFPQIAAIRASNRRATAERFISPVASSWSPHAPLWSGSFVTPFFPRAYGDAITAPILPGVGYKFPEMATGYPGAAAWLLALLVLRPGSVRRREIAGLAAIAGLALAAAAWTWPLVELVSHLPGIGVMLPLRFLGWVPIAVSALAAFELDRLRIDLVAAPRSVLWLLAAAILFAAGGAAVFRHFRPAYVSAGGYAAEKSDLRGLGFILVAVGVAAAIAALPRLSSAFRERLLVAALLCAAATELFLIARPFDRLGRSALVYPDTPLVDFLRGRPGPFRTVGVGPALFPNTNVFAAVEDVRTHDPMERKDYVAFLDATCGYPPGEYFKIVRDLDATSLAFLNARYAVGVPRTAAPGPRWSPVYSGTDGVVFENRDESPRVFAPLRVRSFGAARRRSFDDAFAAFGRAPALLLAGIDLTREALVVADDDGFPEANAGGTNAARISGIRESTNTLSFTASAESPAVVVATVVQDGGWSARDDHGTLPMGRANGPFLAIAVPPGARRVVLRYRPPGLRSGAAVSAAAIAFALLAEGLAGRSRRRRSERPEARPGPP